MKRILLLLALAGMAPLAAGAEIRLWHGFAGAQAEAFEALVAKFNAAHPVSRVVLTYKGSYASYAALAERRKDLAPHLMQADEVRTADLAMRADLRPLWEVLAAAQRPLDATVVPALAAPFSDTRGRLLALPLYAATPVLYFNRDAFRRARLDPERALRTWYEVANTLGALIDAGERCGYTTAWPAWVLLENMSAWHNQPFATQEGGAGARLAFNNQLIVRWVSMLATWKKSGYFTYAGRGDEAEALFAAGECAALTSSSASHGSLRERAQFELGVAPLPYFDDFEAAPQNTLVRGSALWVLAGGSAAEYAGIARFIDFLLRTDVQAEWHQRTGSVPLTRIAYELTRAQGFYLKQPGYEVAVRQLAIRRPTPESGDIRLGALPRIRVIANEELEAVWSGGKTPVEALNAAVTRGNALLPAAR